MFGLFDDRIIEVNEHTTPDGRPVKTYQFVRPASTKSQFQSQLVPKTTTIVHNPSPDLKPIKDTFQPPEGDDLAITPYHGGNGGQKDTFHPLPPLIHQYPPQLQLPYPTNNHNNHHNQPQDLFGPPAHPDHHNHPHNKNPINPHRGHHSSDHGTVVVLDGPAELPRRHFRRRHSRDQRVVRVNRSHPSNRSQSRIRGSDGRYYYPASCSSGSGGGYYYTSSDGTTRSGSSDSTDSWDRGTLKSEYGYGYADWSDGGDSWDEDEGEVVLVKAKGNGDRKGKGGVRLIEGGGHGRLRIKDAWDGREGRGHIYLK